MWRPNRNTPIWLSSSANQSKHSRVALVQDRLQALSQNVSATACKGPYIKLTKHWKKCTLLLCYQPYTDPANVLAKPEYAVTYAGLIHVRLIPKMLTRKKWLPWPPLLRCHDNHIFLASTSEMSLTYFTLPYSAVHAEFAILFSGSVYGW